MAPSSSLLVELVVALALLWQILTRWHGRSVPKQFLGLETLYEGFQTAIDIVAVSGRGSSEDWIYTSKQADKQVHWLRDSQMLPMHVPNTRIIAYNYDPTWASDAPRAQLRHRGMELLEHLAHFREGCEGRPIVFVGHGLGGLIISHALLHAKDLLNQDLLHSTVGFVALGTPFREARRPRRFADCVARIFNYSNFHLWTMDTIMSNQFLTSHELQRLVQLFEKEHITAFCFSEAYKTAFGKIAGSTRWLRGMVVGEESALVPEFSGQRLFTDHLELSQLSGPDEDSFSSLSQVIKSLCSDWNVRSKSRYTGQTLPLPSSFDPVPKFVGRDTILRSLMLHVPPNAKPEICQKTIIHGLAGSGKTRIAQELVSLIQKEHRGCQIFWVSALNVVEFQNGYRRVSQRLGVQPPKLWKSIVGIIGQQEMSSSHGDWLLIIDDADDETMLSRDRGPFSCFPNSCRGSILILTRHVEALAQIRHQVSHDCKVCDLGTWDAEDMMNRNIRTVPASTGSGNAYLAQVLGGSPLAISLATAYMRQMAITADRYLDLYFKQDVVLIDKLSTGFPDRGLHRDPVASAWLLSFDWLSNKHRVSAKCLQCISVFAATNIPGDVFMQALYDEGSRPEAGEPGEDILNVLETYGFVTAHQDEDSYNMLRLVREATRNWLMHHDKFSEQVSQAGRVLNRLGVDPADHTHSSWINYVPHLQEMMTTGNIQITKENQQRILMMLGYAYFHLGEHSAAEAAWREFLNQSVIAYGHGHPTTLSTGIALVNILAVQRKYEEAQDGAESMVSNCESLLGSEHPDTLVSMELLGNILAEQGKKDQCKLVHEEVNARRQRIASRGRRLWDPKANMPKIYFHMEYEHLRTRVARENGADRRCASPDSEIMDLIGAGHDDTKGRSTGTKMAGSQNGSGMNGSDPVKRSKAFLQLGRRGLQRRKS